MRNHPTGPEPHPHAVLWPPLPPDVYQRLKQSIAEHGVLNPVVVDQDGRIIDGVHRARACAELGREYPTLTLPEGFDPHEAALRFNADRRHASPTALAVVADLASARTGRGRPGKGADCTFTVEAAARLVGASVRLTKTVRRLRLRHEQALHRQQQARLGDGEYAPEPPDRQACVIHDGCTFADNGDTPELYELVRDGHVTAGDADKVSRLYTETGQWRAVARWKQTRRSTLTAAAGGLTDRARPGQ